MQNNIDIVLVRSRFPENIGMVARACANMGVETLALVLPERWEQKEEKEEPGSSLFSHNPCAPSALTYKEKAAALATLQGEKILEGACVFSSLDRAVGQSTMVFGTTARLGGWRQNVITPEAAALAAMACLEEGGRVSFVFGSEDTGLLNNEIEQCHKLICIPTAPQAASLNLAQAVLIILYELQKQLLKLSDSSSVHRLHTRHGGGRLKNSPPATAKQKELLLDKMEETLHHIDYLPDQNAAYFMLPLRNFIGSIALKRNEHSILMGVCRKILYLTKK